jgi:hypothetical protein
MACDAIWALAKAHGLAGFDRSSSHFVSKIAGLDVRVVARQRLEIPTTKPLSFAVAWSADAPGSLSVEQ